MKRPFRMLFVSVLVTWVVLPLYAADLKIGIATEPSTLDPQFESVGATITASRQIFDTLIMRDENLQPQPGLALSWKPIDELTWEVKLRPGVKFHDGSDFNADDVVYSINRIPRMPESPSSYKRNVTPIAQTLVVDPLTVRFKLKKPYPQLPLELSFLFIVSNQLPETVTSDDFNKGKATIGTGAFKFIEWVRGDRLVLQRYDGYWGKKASFDRVIFKPIFNDPSRVTSLLAGDVDVINQVPPSDLLRLKNDPKVSVWGIPADRMIYVHMDTNRDQSPFVFAKDGSKLTVNPLKDVRVRRAFSKAINRQLLVEKVLNGAATPSGQFVPAGMVGHIPDLKPEPFDPEGAKKLLVEAGYPDGFSLTIHCTNNRYVNDEQVGQTVAQFLARIGMNMKVQALPQNVFFTRATALEFSFFMVGFGNMTGDAARGLTAVLGTYDTKTGAGANNRGRYSNPEFDRLMAEAANATDPKKRESFLQEATRLAVVKDVGIIPLHFEMNTWATRKGLSIVARMDEDTLANWVTLQK